MKKFLMSACRVAIYAEASQLALNKTHNPGMWLVWLLFFSAPLIMHTMLTEIGGTK